MVNGRPKNWRVEVDGIRRGCGWQELKDWARDSGLTPAVWIACRTRCMQRAVHVRLWRMLAFRGEGHQGIQHPVGRRWGPWGAL